LAIETTAAACSAALWHDGAVVVARRRTMEHGHAVALLPMMEEVMAAAGLGFGELGCVAVCVGPGSFTGVRVGLATARALALAAGIPAVGVSAFEAVCAVIPVEEMRGRGLAVLLESRRRDLFVQCFGDDSRPLHPACAVAPDGLGALLPAGPLLLAGNAVERGRAALVGDARDVALVRDAAGPDACGVAVAAAAWQGVAASPMPLYLRAPDARLPAARR
jgi:tRNA threonylcarbamoyladenosine biosynthesis protein TsaB